MVEPDDRDSTMVPHSTDQSITANTSDTQRRIPPRMAARRWAAAACGVVAALAALASAEVVALFVGAESSPFFAVGAWIVDLSPTGFKHWIIDVFGGADKLILFICLGLFLLAVACVIGVLAAASLWGGSAALVLICVIAGVAVVTRPDSSPWWAAPIIIGAIVGVLVLYSAIFRLQRWKHASEPARVPNCRPEMERRSFLTYLSLAAAVAVAAGIGARAVNAGSAAVTTVRNALKLPAPDVASAPIPSGADFHLAGLAPYITPNHDFYRVDTALQVPAVDPDSWKLRITGMVDNEVTLSFAQLLALPLTEHVATLSCVSNEVGGDLVGNATWLGYPIRDLLERARPHHNADMVLSRSTDGWTAATPIDVLTDPSTEALLAVGMNGKPLPLEHGFPVRIVVPGLYGYVSATKWVTSLEVSQFAKAQGYWTDKGWSAQGPVKTESRVDTPLDRASVSAGTVAIAGAAWDPHTGIDRVEVRIDDGQWQKAQLAKSASADTWRQWLVRWDATPGSHTIAVRATNAGGATQTAKKAPPAPNGASGWHTIHVKVN